jgi:chromosome segregation ATPase
MSYLSSFVSFLFDWFSRFFKSEKSGSQNSAVQVDTKLPDLKSGSQVSLEAIPRSESPEVSSGNTNYQTTPVPDNLQENLKVELERKRELTTKDIIENTIMVSQLRHQIQVASLSHNGLLIKNRKLRKKSNRAQQKIALLQNNVSTLAMSENQWIERALKSEQHLASKEKAFESLKVSYSEQEQVIIKLNQIIFDSKLNEAKPSCVTEKEIDEINLEKHQLSTRLVQIENDLRICTEEKEELVVRLNEHKIATDSLEKIGLERQEKFEKACRRISELQKEVRNHCCMRTTLQRENAALKKSFIESEDKYSKKLQEFNQFHSEATEKMRSFYKRLINNRESEIKELSTYVDQLEEENKGYQRKIDQYDDEHRVERENQAMKISQLEDANAQLNVQVEELENATYALPDYYRILNLDREATDAEIRKAYLKKVLEVHPDKIKQMHPDSNEKVFERSKRITQVLNRAKKILEMPRLKYQYDSWLDMTELKKAEERQNNFDRMYNP